MPIIIREFQCGDCDHKFESSDPVEVVCCPRCSSQEAERAFFTPPGIKSPQTAKADRELKGLAADYGLTNMSNKEGAPVRQAPPQGAAPQFATGNAQAMQMVQRLGSNADGFSPVLPALSRAGGPRPEWAARDTRNKAVR
jgi:hypothetical protein